MCRRLSQPDSPGSAEAGARLWSGSGSKKGGAKNSASFFLAQEAEGSSSSPDLEILRARQQRLRELKAGLAQEAPGPPLGGHAL